MPTNLVEQIDSLNLPDGTLLDGEIWNPLKRGSWKHHSGISCKLTFWDTIRIGGSSVQHQPIEYRFEKLSELLNSASKDVSIVPRFEATAEQYMKVLASVKAARQASELRSGFIHGAVLKRKGSPRRDSNVRCVEHPDWLKIVIEP